MTSVFTRPDIMLARAMLDDRPAIDIEDIDEELMSVEPSLLAAVKDPQMTMEAMARLVEGKHLGQEDLFYIISHPGLAEDTSAIMPVVREGLDYPAADMAGVLTDFKTLPIEKGGQVAYIVITPDNIDLEKRPLVFLTGLHHKSAIYYDTLVRMAQKDRRGIISIDLPSAGGTRLPENDSVYASDLFDSAVKVIGAEIKAGETFDLMAHSLGAIPAVSIRSAFKKGELPSSLRDRHLGRVVLVAPVPDEEMRMLGDRLDGSFTKAAVLKAAFTGGVSATAAHLFFNRHSEDEQKELAVLIGREEHAASIWSICSTFFSRYLDPVMQDAGSDPSLRIVFPEEDILMSLRGQKDWRDKSGIYFIVGADHSFMAGHLMPEYRLDQLLFALNDSEDIGTFSKLDLDRIYRRFSGNAGVALSYSSSGFVGADASITAGLGGFYFGSGGGIDLGFGNEIIFGYDYKREDGQLGMRLHLGPGYKLSQLPLRFDGGLLFQINMYLNETNDSPARMSPYAGLQFEMEDAVFLSARFLFPAFAGDDSTDWSTQVNFGFLF